MQWVNQHYELLFGGFGTVILTTIIGFVWRHLTKKRARPAGINPSALAVSNVTASPSVSQNVSQHFSPTVNIHPPAVSAPILIQSPKRELKNPPNVVRSRVRTCFVTRTDEHGGMFTEVPEGGMTAVVATFYNQIELGGGQISGAESVRARMRFYVGDDVAYAEEIAFGTWLDRRLNSVDLGAEDSRDLLIALRASDNGIGLIEDRREPIAADYFPTVFKKELIGNRFDVEVKLSFKDDYGKMLTALFWFEVGMTKKSMVITTLNPAARVKR
jgi:hypothetical protein